jgi:hypothetical protein
MVRVKKCREKADKLCVYGTQKRRNLPSQKRTAMKKKIGIFLMAILTLLIFTPSSPAQVYQYKDKNGVVHYSNVPNDPKYKPSSSYINKKSPKKPTKNVKKAKKK